jgi:hypothetical protein
MVLPSTPRSVMLSQAHPHGGREYDILAEGVCEVPRWAEGKRRSASWVPSMVRRRGPVACGGGGMAVGVSLCCRRGRESGVENEIVIGCCGCCGVWTVISGCRGLVIGWAMRWLADRWIVQAAAAQADRQRQGKVLVSVLRRARASSRPKMGRLGLENGCRRVRSGPLALSPSIGYRLTERTYKTASRFGSDASGREAGPQHHHIAHRPEGEREQGEERQGCDEHQASETHASTAMSARTKVASKPSGALPRLQSYTLPLSYVSLLLAYAHANRASMG